MQINTNQGKTRNMQRSKTSGRHMQVKTRTRVLEKVWKDTAYTAHEV